MSKMDSMEDDNNNLMMMMTGDVLMSSVDHCTSDPISQEAAERLEMRRLGLPLSFASSKKKKRGKKNSGGKKQNNAYRKAAVSAKVDAGAGGEQFSPPPTPDDFELIYFEDENHQTEDAPELMEAEEVASMGSSGSGPDEVATLKLTNDSYDSFVDLDKLRISGNEDNDQQQQQLNKRDRPEDDNTTTTSTTTTTTTTTTTNNNNNNNSVEMESREDDLMISTSNHHRQLPPPKKRSKYFESTNYYRQRYTLFSRYDDGIRLDKESWYSVTPEPIAGHIARRIERALLRRRGLQNEKVEDDNLIPANQFIILDGFCGAGGNTIQFALRPSTALVYAVDIDPAKIELARNNAKIYDCLDKIQFLVADFFDVINNSGDCGDTRVPLHLVDACFLSPPWGGPDYNSYESYSLTQMTPDGFEIARWVADRVTKNISFLLPRNFDMGEVQQLLAIVYRRQLTEEDEEVVTAKKSVAVEKNKLNGKVKTMTAYFGDLVIREDHDNDKDEEEE